MSTRQTMGQTIAELRRLTESLPEFGPDMYVKSEDDCSITITHGFGKISAEGLIHRPQIAVADCIAETGSSMEEHTHPETEIFIVYEGIYHVTTPTGTTVLNSGDLMKIAPGIPHATHCPETCMHIAVTIPSSASFPMGVTDVKG